MKDVPLPDIDDCPVVETLYFNLDVDPSKPLKAYNDRYVLVDGNSLKVIIIDVEAYFKVEDDEATWDSLVDVRKIYAKLEILKDKIRDKIIEEIGTESFSIVGYTKNDLLDYVEEIINSEYHNLTKSWLGYYIDYEGILADLELNGEIVELTIPVYDHIKLRLWVHPHQDY